MKQYSFERLNVWKESIDLVQIIYKLSNKFPDEEKYGLCSQMKRACISISSNLAEGSSRLSNKDQARFTVMAYSSALEVLNQLIISKELCYIQQDDYIFAREKIEKITNMMNALKKSQLNA